ncbi:flagellar basal-body MS-ring/collar protein FliF [Actibacterium sp. MT2.3-13A]|uniref:flagellar basal-body MS-ring/collar protein FliF n=1 Tax=Actibacterium sp. MT2.3-13A TaxID=2828332 RepID=UPI001BAB0639
MKSIIDNLAALGRTRLIALAATGLGLMLALFFGLSSVMAPSFVPLYSDLTPAGASRIVSTLEQAGFEVDLSGGGAIVSVPQDDIARARMTLADNGLPNEGTPGWELFDNSSGLGMNSFLQRVNRLRALEGELARSIQTIDGIDAARVHLVLPEREAFSRSRPEPTASVIVRSRANHQISRRQGLAIRALVASAVPSMSPEHVTVLSASGETILADDGDGMGDLSLQSRRAAIEERLARNITGILTARVGAGNARVQVSVDLSSERQVIRQESYDPAQQVVRSTESREETSEGRESAQGEVGVADDLPAELAGGGTGGAGSSNSRTQSNEIVNYEIGATRSETIREPGEIERISVAVLVNGIYSVAKDGSVSYEERGAEELERLGRLVQSAIGYDQARGDAVSVDSLRFMDYSMDVGEPVGTSVGEVISANIMSILRGVFALALVAAVLAFGVRPMMRLLPAADAGGALALAGAEAGAGPAALTGAAPRPLLGAEGAAGGAPKALASAQAAPSQAAEAPRTGTVLEALDEDEGDLIALASVRGGVRRRRLTSIGELVEAEPEESLRVLRHWLAEEV